MGWDEKFSGNSPDEGGWTYSEHLNRLELENQNLVLRIEVYEEILDFYGHLKEAHRSLAHRMREERRK